MSSSKSLVVLTGNPNSGKTSLFNALTGSQQKVGNYAGVTVDKISANMNLSSIQVDCLDVPGIYSLDPISLDEMMATEVLKGISTEKEKPSLLVCVLDANNLERHLYLYSQLLETGIPMIVALTMVDLLPKGKKSIDIKKLSSILDTQVICVNPTLRDGITDLKNAIEAQLNKPSLPATNISPKPEGVSMVTHRYRWAAATKNEVLIDKQKSQIKINSDKIDRIFTHQFWGLLLFTLTMFIIFHSLYSLSAPIMDFMDYGFQEIKNLLSKYLVKYPLVKSLVVNGIIPGVGTTLMFLPQISILFFFITLLESTGYLARAAFLMDKLLGWCGLNGRSFIPLMSSYACAVPGIMAARVIPDPKARLATVLVAPLMSCSARLPVYVLLIGTFIEPLFGSFWAGFSLFAIHILGLLVAIPVIYSLNKGVLKTPSLPFIMELPPYQWPKWKDIFHSVFRRSKHFVKDAGSTILVLSIIIWALAYLPIKQPPENQILPQEITSSLKDSYLGKFGKIIEPIFEPLGFDWRISTAILASFPAREVIITSLSIMFQPEKERDELNLKEVLKQTKNEKNEPVIDGWSAIGLMVFFSLCCQCSATLATIKTETGSWKWPVFVFTYMSILAYVGAYIVQVIKHIVQ